jgi:S1-C subfamily serine protease
VTGEAASFKVQVAGDAKLRPAHLAGSFAAGDLAVIRVADASGLKPAVFGDSAKVRAGDVVLAVGNPFGLDGSVTQGIVSAIGRNVPEPATSGVAAALPDAIQTSAPINPGNSGGALVTTTGEVIGITTLAATSPGGGGQAQGIGFAIPSSLARDIAGQLITSGHVTNSHRAALGAQVADVTNGDGSPAGAGLVSLTAGGAADRAGLRAGDTIRSLGQVQTPDTAALTQALATVHPGDKVPVSLVRAGGEITVTVQLGEL